MPQMSPMTWPVILVMLIVAMKIYTQMIPSFSKLNKNNNNVEKKEKKMKW